MTTVYMVRNDTYPPLEAILTWKDGSAIDLTDCTVRFHMKKGDVLLVDRAATVVSATEGKVRYDWQVGDTDVVGVCQAEFEVTFPNGKVTTFPSEGFLYVSFREELK